MNPDSKPTTFDELIASKGRQRKSLASEKVEDKIKVLVKLQQLASSVARQSGRPYKEPWNIQPKNKDSIS
jgi:hypothetical protein